ncbi:MAG: endonuclease/exonuclease/phosphatase family protein, partial [Actinomycetota bacterium]|nr:endonuclease/exonuclease/phosphatase family protein [Actinomycetota bacterium]
MPETFKIMTFNVRGSQHKDGENVWNKRAPLNVRTIERYAPDLIGFQEHQVGNRKVHDAKLDGYERISGPRYENREPHAHNAIYWRTDRMELVERGGFWLSETPGEYSRSWDARHVRSANWARFRVLSGGAEFVHLNTHLDHISGRARQQGAKLILRRLDELGDGLPVVLTGDFNCDPGSTTYGIFAGAGFGDVHIAAGNGRSNTFHHFRGDEFRPKKPGREVRIDWILPRDALEQGRW